MARIHLNLDDDLLGDLDRLAGPRGRSAFIAAATAEKIEHESRWELILSAIGTVPEDGTHAWDGMDAGEWVRQERQRGSKRQDEWDTSS
ncbi:MAG: hypothetical protein M3010_00355 [Candidatus Dormibacteraeota bacterium]|nr:hypothetical protein [Candidatus Dormibacteraeota bacterium]